MHSFCLEVNPLTASSHPTSVLEAILPPLLRAATGSFAVLLLLAFTVFCSPQVSPENDENTLVIESSPDMEIISFSKKVVVRNEAKGVLVFGSDVVVEGRIEGDVAAIGGSIIQREGSYIGGDVIVFGGKYMPDSVDPLRGENKQTIIFAAYEEEFRSLAQNPLQIFSPSISVAFVALRVVSLLFWFVISLIFTTIAPGAVSRAVSRINLSPAKVIAIGLFTFIGSVVLIIAGSQVIPTYLMAVLLPMALLMLTLAYVFGRVALHVKFGKLIQKYVLSDQHRSESLSMLLGVLAWTILLSIPYVWTFALLALFSAGIGLVLTARSTSSWASR